MTIEEIKEKVKRKEITLEALNVEDILKIYSDVLINSEVEELFEISKNELVKIRKLKGLNDVFFENEIRNDIIFYDYVLDNYEITKKEFFDVIYPILFDVNHVNINKRILSIERKWLSLDWKNMDPKEEIKLREIDVQFRLNKYKSRFERLKFSFDSALREKRTLKELDYSVLNFKNKKKITPKVNVTEVYPRNPEVSENALRFACYYCENDINHPTFIRKKNGMRYMEPHHLVPLEFQDMFEYNLDIESNIICLCSNCHNEIYYGVDKKKLIKKFYNERIESLKLNGINIKLDELYNLYNESDVSEKV